MKSFINLFLFLPLIVLLEAHPPSNTPLYQAKSVYEQVGKKKPVLADDVICIVDGEGIPLAKYKEWLYKQTAFFPMSIWEYKLYLLITKWAKSQSIKIDESSLELLVDRYANFSLVNKKQFKDTNYDLQLKRAKHTLWKNLSKHWYLATYLDHTIEDFLNWIPKSSFYEDINTSSAYSTLETLSSNENKKETDSLQNIKIIIQFTQRHENVVISYLEKNLNIKIGKMSFDKKAYREWLYRHSHSEIFLENFVLEELVQSKWRGDDKPLNRVLSLELSNRGTKASNDLDKAFVSFNIPRGEFTHWYSFFEDNQKSELLFNLRCSRLLESNKGILDALVLKAFYSKYGYEGREYELEHIFKWIRKRYLPKGEFIEKGLQKKIESQIAAKKNELDSLKKTTTNFFELALTHSEESSSWLNLGIIGQFNAGWLLNKEIDTAINKLKVGEVSSVYSSQLGYHLFYVYQKTEKIPYFAQVMFSKIDKEVDWKTYASERDVAVSNFNRLISINKNLPLNAWLDRNPELKGYRYEDISKKWFTLYGVPFAKKLVSLKKGEFKIIEGVRGVHLVKILSVVETPINSKIRSELKNEIESSVHSQNLINEYCKRLLYRKLPYYEWNLN